MCDVSIPPELQEYREQIDLCDREIIDALKRRFDVVHKVGEFKREAKMDAVQPVRAQAVKDRAVVWGQENGLDPEFVSRVYDVLIDYAHDLEHDILDDESA